MDTTRNNRFYKAIAKAVATPGSGPAMIEWASQLLGAAIDNDPHWDDLTRIMKKAQLLPGGVFDPQLWMDKYMNHIDSIRVFRKAARDARYNTTDRQALRQIQALLRLCMFLASSFGGPAIAGGKRGWILHKVPDATSDTVDSVLHSVWNTHRCNIFAFLEEMHTSLEMPVGIP